MTRLYNKPSLNISLSLSYTCPKTGKVVYLDGQDVLNVLEGWSDPGSEDGWYYSSSGIKFSIWQCKECGKNHDEDLK